ncbi:MAG: hypothetical protein CVV27_19125, partial [Candidatus Melainabacteria bacterium HGW-Melainabacteria-1]
MKAIQLPQTKLAASLAFGLTLSLVLSACDSAPKDNQQMLERTTTTRDVADQNLAADQSIYKDRSQPDGANNQYQQSANNRQTDANDNEQIAKLNKDTAMPPNTLGDPKDPRTLDNQNFLQDSQSLRQDGAGADIVGLTLKEQELSTFHQLMALADLTDHFDSGLYTLLAPNNQAFAKVPKVQMD